MSEDDTELVRALTRGLVKNFLDKLPPEFGPDRFAIEQEDQIQVLERLVALEETLRKTTAERELIRENSAADREIRRQDATARLKLLSRITWMAGAIVVVDLALLTAVVLASVYTPYKPDEWFIRILAGGPLASIIGMLGAIVAHYWPRKGEKGAGNSGPQ